MAAINPSTRKKHVSSSLELYQDESSVDSHLIRLRLSELGLDFLARNPAPGQTRKPGEIPLLVDHSNDTILRDTQSILAYLDKKYPNKAAHPSAELTHRMDRWL